MKNSLRITKVTNGDRELIMCKRKSDGVEGVYDPEEKTFKTLEECFPNLIKTYNNQYQPVEYINDNNDIIAIGEKSIQKYIKPSCSLCGNHKECEKDKICNADHRKQRGRTAPNRALDESKMTNRGKRAELKIIDDAIDSGIKAEVKGYLIEAYNPKPGEVIVWKFNTITFNLDQINKIFKLIESSFPNNTVVGIPDDTFLELIDRDKLIEILNDSIKDLEESI